MKGNYETQLIGWLGALGQAIFLDCPLV